MTLKILSKTILFFVLYTSSFFAASEFVTIQNFRVWSNTYGSDTIRVDTPGSAFINPQSCTDPDSYMVSAELDDKSKARIYSALLAAVMAKKPITLWVNGCERDRPAILNTIIE
jgi:hypothetical protein